MVDENLGALNMPTRSEIRTLQDRLQETRRENKQLRQELEQLQDKLEALAASATRSAPQRKAAPRKKATAKKQAASDRISNGTTENRSKRDN
jgi:regulator of replication initiation timing